jgi:hypothetical protein
MVSPRSREVIDKGKSLYAKRKEEERVSLEGCSDKRIVQRPSASPLPTICSLPSPSQFFPPLPYSNYGPATSSGLPPQEAGFPPPLYVVCDMYWCFGMCCLVVCVHVGKKGGLRYRRRENSALLSQLQRAAAVTATVGCVLSSAQLNTLEKVSAVRSQRPVQAERSVFAGRARRRYSASQLNPQAEVYISRATSWSRGGKRVQGLKYR